MTETYTVYKAVLKTASPTHFTSWIVDNDAMLTYNIGKETVCDTPIFVFLWEDEALEGADANTVILKGTTTTYPINPPSLQFLNLIVRPSKLLIQQFWKEYWQHEDGIVWTDTPALLRISSPNTRLVYNFTPQEIINYK